MGFPIDATVSHHCLDILYTKQDQFHRLQQQAGYAYDWNQRDDNGIFVAPLLLFDKDDSQNGQINVRDYSDHMP